MKAARWYAAKDVRVEETAEPVVGTKQIKIEVKFAGICGSDLHEYVHGPNLIPSTEPYPLNNHFGVTTLGHEFSGVVTEVSEDSQTDIKPGDRVVVEPIFKNPKSPFVNSGEYNLSEPLGFVGLSANGGFAPFVVVEDYMVHKIPDSMTFEQGALVEPAAVAVYSVMQSGLKMGESCAIFGAGPIGLLCLQAAMAAGAGKTFVIDVSEKRLQKAKELGADYIINGLDSDIPEQIRKITGLGVDRVIDAAGVQSTFTNGMKALRNGGTNLLVALFGKPVTFDAFDAVCLEKIVKGVIAYRNIFPQVIQLIDSKKMDVEKLVTRKITLDNIVNDGFEALIKDPSEVKILIDIANS